MLHPPYPMQSAYSCVMKNILDLINFHKNCVVNMTNEDTYKKLLEANPTIKSLNDHIKDINVLDNITVYGVKIGINEIEKTNTYVKHFTLEPALSFYSNRLFGNFDYIFFNGDINPIRSLNSPDARKIAMEIGEFPNEHYPSDHISICVDFKILTY